MFLHVDSSAENSYVDSSKFSKVPSADAVLQPDVVARAIEQYAPELGKRDANLYTKLKKQMEDFVSDQLRSWLQQNSSTGNYQVTPAPMTVQNKPATAQQHARRTKEGSHLENHQVNQLTDERSYIQADSTTKVKSRRAIPATNCNEGNDLADSEVLKSAAVGPVKKVDNADICTQGIAQDALAAMESSSSNDKEDLYEYGFPMDTPDSE